eukprot:CAMPEP_0176285066 /NCGR_PEP_ID=MMETSP0121_2-20121125/52174_1 /TAXON_ID=160619 /ORGANISM="Kryptoperidinium foliaceum, Strain CCMP 1326" /LENGTH=66 /DNA_ID=CAMNT_0017625531 /DNA_START=26 /DNA_END=222 /DNA_ORIENTATION=+
MASSRTAGHLLRKPGLRFDIGAASGGRERGLYTPTRDRAKCHARRDPSPLRSAAHPGLRRAPLQPP